MRSRTSGSSTPERRMILSVDGWNGIGVFMIVTGSGSGDFGLGRADGREGLV